MKYIEKYLFYKRTFEIVDGSIHVIGNGLILPCYDMKFKINDLNSEVRKVKVGNRFQFVPLLFLVIATIILLFICGYLNEYITEYPFGICAILTAVECIMLLFLIFHRTWWITYVNKSGLDCFSLVDKSGKDEDYKIFCTEINRLISSGNISHNLPNA